jgi:PA domain/LVIVD repeat
MEDMQAIRIRGRDILAIGLQDCGNSATEGTVGLELYDISDPRNPQFLTIFNGEDIPGLMADHGHAHEFDLVKRRDGRVLAALASPDSEALTADPETALGSIGDLLIVDITDPAAPTLVGEYGVLNDPMFGVDFYLSVRQGGDARTLDHGARFNQRGTRLHLSYWDAGVIILDVRDPANPTVLGRTAFQEREEGNAHSIDTADRESILIQADEDFSPFELQFTSSAFEGQRPAVEGQNSPPIVRLPGREMAGEVVHVGRGCPADPRPTPPDGPGSGITVEDPYLADPPGKIALIERGGCRFDNKIARAQQAGPIGVIVYNNEAGGEALVLMGIDSPVVDGPPGIEGTEIEIPAVFVQRSTGLLLREGPPPVTAAVTAIFNGWATCGSSTSPVRRTRCSSAPSRRRTRSTRTSRSTAFGACTIRSSSGGAAAGVRRTSCTPPADAPPVNIWSVVPRRRILLVSDRNFGLYVLKHRGDRR